MESAAFEDLHRSGGLVEALRASCLALATAEGPREAAEAVLRATARLLDAATASLWSDEGELLAVARRGDPSELDDELSPELPSLARHVLEHQQPALSAVPAAAGAAPVLALPLLSSEGVRHLAWIERAAGAPWFDGGDLARAQLLVEPVAHLLAPRSARASRQPTEGFPRRRPRPTLARAAQRYDDARMETVTNVLLLGTTPPPSAPPTRPGGRERRSSRPLTLGALFDGAGGPSHLDD